MRDMAGTGIAGFDYAVALAGGETKADRQSNGALPTIRAEIDCDH
jgi:hypothetical protein